MLFDRSGWPRPWSTPGSGKTTPTATEFYLGSPGWLHRIELEASTVGFSPWPNGPPYPHLERAFAEGDEMRFWIRFPPALRADGTISARARCTVIRRYVDQLEFEW